MKSNFKTGLRKIIMYLLVDLFMMILAEHMGTTPWRILWRGIFTILNLY